MSNVIGDGGGAVNVQKDVPLFAPSGKAFGQNYFTAPDTDTYDRVRLGKNRYHRWDSFVGKTDWARNVASWAKSNKGGILMKHPSYNSFMPLRR